MYCPAVVEDVWEHGGPILRASEGWGITEAKHVVLHAIIKIPHPFLPEWMGHPSFV